MPPKSLTQVSERESLKPGKVCHPPKMHTKRHGRGQVDTRNHPRYDPLLRSTNLPVDPLEQYWNGIPFLFLSRLGGLCCPAQREQRNPNQQQETQSETPATIPLHSIPIVPKQYNNKNSKDEVREEKTWSTQRGKDKERRQRPAFRRKLKTQANAPTYGMRPKRSPQDLKASKKRKEEKEKR